MKTCYIIGDGLLTSLCVQQLVDDPDWKVLGLISSAAFLKKKWDGFFPIYDDLIRFEAGAEKFDYLFSIINPNLLPREILSLPKYFSINYHSSLLPKYAGWDPGPWIILNNEKKHGITWHIMTEKFDKGRIILQVPIELNSDETAKTLHQKCFKTGINSFKKLLSTLENKNESDFFVQNNKLRTYISRKKKPDNLGFIDWNLPGNEIERFCRAFYFGGEVNWVTSPKLKLDSNIYIVEEVKSLPIRSFSKPGTFVSIDRKCLVISTQTTDVMVTVLRDLTGNLVLPSKLKKNIGKLLSIDASFFEELKTVKKNHIDEYWLAKEFSNYNPLKISGIPVLDKIEKEETFQLKTKERDFSDQITTLLFYLSKFTCKENISLKIRNYNKKLKTQDDLKKIICKDIPFNFCVNDDFTFDVLKTKVKNILSNEDYQGSYLKDFFYRFKPILKNKERLFFEEKISVVLCEDVDSYENEANGFQILFFRDGGSKIIISKESPEFSFFAENIKTQLPLLQDRLLKNNKMRLKDVSLLSKEEERKITIDWNKKESNYNFCSLFELISKMANIYPKKIAVKTTSGSQVSYEMLIKKSENIANSLFYDYGISPQDQVCICMNRSHHLIILIVALLRLNCIIIPVPTLLGVERMNNIIKVKAFITDDNDLYSKIQSKKYNIITIKFYSIDKKISPLSQVLPNIEVQPTDTVLITFTSGSTGVKKAIPTTHNGWVNWIYHMKLNGYVNKNDVIYSACPFDFDAFYWEVYVLGLGQGSSLIISGEGERLNTGFCKNLFRQETFAITQVTMTPSFLSRFKPSDFPYLKKLYCIGEKLTRELIDPFLEKIVVINGYGPSEVTAGVTLYSCILGQTPYVGKPIQNMAIYILDKYKSPVPIGAEGEIYISGLGVTTGYIGLPEKNKESFIENPFDSEEKMYKTGDKARYVNNQGVIEFISRIREDKQVKHLGVRIELNEIEYFLKKIPNIRSVYVRLFQGEERQCLVAYVTGDSKTFSEKNIKMFLSKKLEPVKIPEKIILLEKLPTNTRGKIDLSSLPNPILTYTPIYNDDSLSLTDRMLSIWRHCLNSPHFELVDKLNECGASSFARMHIWEVLNKVILNGKFDVTPLVDFLTCNTVFEMVSLVEKITEEKISKNTTPIRSSEKILSLNIFESSFGKGSKKNKKKSDDQSDVGLDVSVINSKTLEM